MTRHLAPSSFRSLRSAQRSPSTERDPHVRCSPEPDIALNLLPGDADSLIEQGRCPRIGFFLQRRLPAEEHAARQKFRKPWSPTLHGAGESLD